MKASVLIPTYRRPADLRRCLNALERLDHAPGEVLVVYRPDDTGTMAVLDAGWQLPLRRVAVHVPGVTAAINRGFDEATGDVVAVIDDDAAPRPDWLTRMLAHYLEDSRLGAVGGRDVVHVDGRPVPADTARVGTISWYGRLVGAHHLGFGAARRVAVLKGVNMSFRTAALLAHRADTRLLGQGAQVHFEVGLCTAIRDDGWDILYDPQVLVDHFPSIRHDSDKRAGFAFDAQFNKAHNEQVMILDHLRPWQRPVFVTWSFLVGTSDVVGLAQLPRVAMLRREAPFRRFSASWSGRAQGLLTWWRARAS